jgi:SAM-dependent methyltransferase
MDSVKLFWDTWYSRHANIIDIPSSFANYINTYYIQPLNTIGRILKIADLGCGNCRDSKLFSTTGNSVISVDKSGVLDISNPNIKLIRDDVEHVLDTLDLKFDLVYMRWFLHAIPYDTAERVFKKSVASIKKDGLICIEVRSLNDTSLIKSSRFDDKDKSYTTDHKRWLYTKEMLLKLTTGMDLEILELVEKYGYSRVSDTEDPLLIRYIARKVGCQDQTQMPSSAPGVNAGV